MADDDAAIARELHAALNGRSRRESSNEQLDVAATITAPVLPSRDPTAAALSHTELSEACSGRGLSGKGKKEVLLARLQRQPPSPIAAAPKARATAPEESNHQKNDPYKEALQRTDRLKVQADTAEAGPEKVQCRRNVLCLTHDKHMGMCKVQKTTKKLHSADQCRRNEHCVRHNRHIGMCNVSAAEQKTTKSATNLPLIPPGTTFQKEFDVGFFTGTVHYYDTVRAHITSWSHHFTVTLSPLLSVTLSCILPHSSVLPSIVVYTILV